jgi:hypothetical protein
MAEEQQKEEMETQKVDGQKGEEVEVIDVDAELEKRDRETDAADEELPKGKIMKFRLVDENGEETEDSSMVLVKMVGMAKYQTDVELMKRMLTKYMNADVDGVVESCNNFVNSCKLVLGYEVENHDRIRKFITKAWLTEFPELDNY